MKASVSEPANPTRHEAQIRLGAFRILRSFDPIPIFLYIRSTCSMQYLVRILYALLYWFPVLRKFWARSTSVSRLIPLSGTDPCTGLFQVLVR